LASSACHASHIPEDWGDFHTARRNTLSVLWTVWSEHCLLPLTCLCPRRNNAWRNWSNRQKLTTSKTTSADGLCCWALPYNPRKQWCRCRERVFHSKEGVSQCFSAVFSTPHSGETGRLEVARVGYISFPQSVKLW
jgi:hypothetical protein